MDETNDTQPLSVPVTPKLAEHLSRLATGAIGVSSYGLASLHADFYAQIRSAIDAGQCQLTVQIDVPSGAVRVLADGPGWLKPQCLFACEFTKTEATAH